MRRRWTGREFADPTGRLMNNLYGCSTRRRNSLGRNRFSRALALAKAHFETIRRHPRKQQDLVQRQLGADYAQLVNRSSNIAHVL